MSDNFEESINDDVKNLYVIKKRLSDVKMNKHGYFEYFVGNSYLIKIYPLEKFPTPVETITLNEKVNIFLYKLTKFHQNPNLLTEEFIDISSDSNFKNYQPIQYTNPPSLSNGKKIPILQLCELVKYLHRLANLKVFT